MSTLRVDALQTLDNSFTINVEDLANSNNYVTAAQLASTVGDGGAALIGYDGGTVADKLNTISIAVSSKGIGSGVTDDRTKIQDLFDTALAGVHLEVIFDSDNDYLLSNFVQIRSNTTLRFTGKGFLKLTQSSVPGSVLLMAGTASAPVVNVRIYEPRIDAGNFGWPTATSAIYGENGLAGTHCKDIKVYGGYIKNCRRGSSNPIGTGGKAIQFESGVEDILVDGTTAIDCTILCESGGIVDDVLPGDTFRRARLVTYTNLKAFNCERLISLSHANSPVSTLVEANNYVIDGVQGFNCGREGPTGTEKNFGLIVNDRASNATIRNVDVFNDATYGALHSIIRQHRGSNCIYENIRFHGDVDQIVSHIVASGWGTVNNLRHNKFGPISHFGTAGYAINATSGDSSNLLENIYDIYTDVVSTGLFHANVQLATLSGKFTDSARDTIIEGQLNFLATGFANTYPTAYKGYAGTIRFNGITLTIGSGVQIFAATDNLQLQSNGSVAQTWSTNKVNTPLSRRPLFADNAAATAGGLAAGDEYRTSTGVVMVRF